jgi:hypothetical protein
MKIEHARSWELIKGYKFMLYLVLYVCYILLESVIRWIIWFLRIFYFDSLVFDDK